MLARSVYKHTRLRVGLGGVRMRVEVEELVVCDEVSEVLELGSGGGEGR